MGFRPEVLGGKAHRSGRPRRDCYGTFVPFHRHARFNRIVPSDYPNGKCGLLLNCAAEPCVRHCRTGVARQVHAALWNVDVSLATQPPGDPSSRGRCDCGIPAGSRQTAGIRLNISSYLRPAHPATPQAPRETAALNIAVSRTGCRSSSPCFI